MEINLVMLKSRQTQYLKQGVLEYSKRIKRYVNFKEKIYKIPKNTGKLSVKMQKRKESELLEKKLKKNDIIFLLDEKGKEYTSKKFAHLLEKQIISSKNLTFVIGGAYGFSNDFKSKYPKISLSKMTFSHQLVRLFFLEQLYRAFTILKGENYHH